MMMSSTSSRNRIQIVCNVCGSANVSRDAEATWDIELQRWELLTVYDNATCNKCEGEASLEEIALSEWHELEDEDE